jgi:predicted ATPase/class 3 adenylate cyclase
MAVGDSNRPTGTITFLFSDIEGSTELAARLGAAAYRDVLEQHQRLLRSAFLAHDGVEQGTEGDSFFVVFRDAPSAVAAAIAGQRALESAKWQQGVAVHVRMGLHSGEGVLGGDDYVGLDVNRAARIAAAGHGGQLLISDSTRALAIESLPTDVAVRDLGEYRLKGLPTPQRLYQLVIAGLRSDFPPLSSLGAGVGNLPPRLTSFVGRERDVEAARQLLGQGRLVTLIGPGGTGKTALAVEIARSAAADLADGAWLVPLDNLTEPDLVPSSIANALGLSDVTGRSARERLLDNLPGRSLLLVLDNFEQVVAAATLTDDLLAAAPRLQLIVTSRSPLRVAAEQVYPVAPLAVPESSDQVDPLELDAVPSVRLFVDRARHVRPDFELTAENAVAVAEICRRLDGLPLGIELAAARINLLGPVGIRDRLISRLGLGGGDVQGVPARQRTLRDTIAWSHDLLDAPGQALFSRVSVFAGGWRLAEAETVCGPASELGGDVLDTLASLVDQSLVTTAAADGTVRFGMLETIREDAAARLSDEAAQAELGRRHALAYLDVAEANAVALTAADRRQAVERFAEERDNFRAAIRWAIDNGDADVGLRLGIALVRFWAMTGGTEEGQSTMTALLEIPGADLPSRRRMRALEALGNLYYYAGDPERPSQMYRAQLELARELDDSRGMTDAQYNLLYTDYGLGQTDEALALMDVLTDSYRRFGDERMVARVGMARGSRLFLTGRPAEAIPILEDALEGLHQVGDLEGEAQTAGSLAMASFDVGDPTAAARWLLTAIVATHASGNFPAVAVGLPFVAMTVFHMGEAEHAATILGAFEGLSRRYGVRPPRSLEQTLEMRDSPEQVRLALDAATYDEAFSRGTTMTVDEVVDFVMEIASRKDVAPPSA